MSTRSARWRWLWRIAIVAGAYLAVVVTFQVGMFVTVGVTRLLGHDPRSDALGSVANLRPVDARLWAGAQPEPEQYEALVDHGVRLVIDLRTGAADDPREDDPAALGELGVEHVVVPVPDGHALSEAAVERVVGLVEEADGIVYLHCGGGVGRSTTAQAAYVAATGEEPSWAELTAIGPVTLEQAWFNGVVGPGDAHAANPVVRRVSEVLDAPRRVFSRVKALF